MQTIQEGSVVIVITGQAGTYCATSNSQVCVLLANGCLWYGRAHEMRLPQSKEDLEACPLEVDRFEGR